MTDDPTPQDMAHAAVTVLLESLPVGPITYAAQADVDGVPALVVVAYGEFAEEILGYIEVAQAESLASLVDPDAFGEA